MSNKYSEHEGRNAKRPNPPWIRQTLDPEALVELCTPVNPFNFKVYQVKENVCIHYWDAPGTTHHLVVSVVHPNEKIMFVDGNRKTDHILNKQILWNELDWNSFRIG